MDKKPEALQHNLEVVDHAAWDHFRGVTKMIVHGNGGSCGLNDEATQ